MSEIMESIADIMLSHAVEVNKTARQSEQKFIDMSLITDHGYVEVTLDEDELYKIKGVLKGDYSFELKAADFDRAEMLFTQMRMALETYSTKRYNEQKNTQREAG